jgi:hypothetical protein
VSKFKIRRVLTALIVFAIGILSGWAITPDEHFPISIWDGNGQIATWYEMEGHQAFHVRMDAQHELDVPQIVDLIDRCITLVGDRLEPDHGLYMVVEAVVAERKNVHAFTLGMTWGAVQEWPGAESAAADFPFHLFQYVDSNVAMIWLGWPEWVDTPTIVWGYAWLVAVGIDREIHPWYTELIYGRPLPLDSAFMFEGN